MSGGYHSSWNGQEVETICGMGVTPLRKAGRGPAPVQDVGDKLDIIDEALKFFKANVLFRNYPIKGPADKTLVYLTLFISEAIRKLVNQDLTWAKKEMHTLSITDFWIPGHAKWPIGGFTNKPASRGEADKVRKWFAQLRAETGARLCELVFKDDQSKPSKWWICFQKKAFLDMRLFELKR